MIGRARSLGERLRAPDIVSYAMNGLGMAMMQRGRDGTAAVERALRIALDADLHEYAGLAYASLMELAIVLHRFDEAERYFVDGTAYCDEHEISVFALCLRSFRAQELLVLGRWDEAAEICQDMLDRREISPVNRLKPLRILGPICGRRGEVGTWEVLDEAFALAERTGEAQWIVPTRLARAEVRWLSGEPDAALEELRSADHRSREFVDPWTSGAVASWLKRVAAPADDGRELPGPLASERAGDWRGAAAEWNRLGRSYDAALAWLAPQMRRT